MKYFLIFSIAGLAIYFGFRHGQSTVDNILIGSGVMDDVNPISTSDEAIAVSNNNPLNIRTSNDNWVGLATPRSVKGFANFVAPEYGYRAAKRIILTAYANEGKTTLAQVISKWAPPNENETTNYINFVTKKSGLRSDTIISSDNIAKLFYAMTIIESGKAQPMSVIERGLEL